MCLKWQFVRAIVLLFALNLSAGIQPVNGKRGKYVNRRVAMRPQLSVPVPLSLPLLRSLNNGDLRHRIELPATTEDNIISPDYAPTAPTSAQAEDDPDNVHIDAPMGSNVMALSNVRALDEPQSGRTFKHMLMLRGLLGGGGSGSGYGGSGGHGGGGGAGGGYSIPYIIINQPMNFTNTNNNSLINQPPPTTTTTARRTPVRYVPLPVNTGGSFHPTEVYRQRQNDQDHPQVSIAIPASTAAAMLGLNMNDLMPVTSVWPNMNAPAVRQRNPQRNNPFEAFANNLRGFQFF